MPQVDKRKKPKQLIPQSQVKLPPFVNLDYFEALSHVESGKNPDIVGLNQKTPLDFSARNDFGLFQFQPTIAHTLLTRKNVGADYLNLPSKDEFVATNRNFFGRQNRPKTKFDSPEGFGQGALDAPDAIPQQTPLERVMLNPYVNAYMAKLLGSEDYFSITKKFPDIAKLPIDDQLVLLQSVHNLGSPEFKRRYEADKDFINKDPKQKKRAARFRKFLAQARKPALTEPEQQAKDAFADIMGNVDQVRKSLVMDGLDDNDEIDAWMSQQPGFVQGGEPTDPEIPQPTTRTARGIAPNPKAITDARKRLTADSPLPARPPLMETLMRDLQQAGQASADFLSQVGEDPLGTLGGVALSGLETVGEAAALPTRAALSFATQGAPEGEGLDLVRSFLENTAATTGTSFNKEILNIPSPQDFEAQIQQHQEQMGALGLEPDTALLQELEGRRNLSELEGGLTETIFSIPPLVPLLKPLGAAIRGTKAGAQEARVVGNGVRTPETTRSLGETKALTTFEPKAVEKPIDIIIETAGDQPLDPADFDKLMSEDIIDAQTGTLQKQAGIPTPDGGTLAKTPFQMKSSVVQDTALDALERLHPLGEQSSLIIRNALQRPEMAVSNTFVDLKEAFKSIWGRRVLASKAVIKRSSGMKFFKYGKRENDAMVELLYRGSTEAVDLTKAPWNFSPSKAEQIKQSAQAVFEIGTKNTSDHAGVRLLKIRQPDGTTRSVGEAGMFFPNIPIDVKLNKILSGVRFKQAFAAAKKKNPSLTEADFRTNIRQVFGRQGFVEGQDADAFRFPGIENARLFDAAEIATQTGKTVAKVLDEYGYETEVLRAVYQFVSSAQRRGEVELIREPVNKLMRQLTQELIDGGHDDMIVQFPKKVLGHFLNVNPEEVVDQNVNRLVSNLLGLNNVTGLQGAGVSNWAQGVFAASQASFPNVVKAAIQTVRDSMRLSPVAERSGALFADMINEWRTPTTVMGKLFQITARATGFTGANRAIRSFSGVLGMHESMRFVKMLAKDPTNKKLRTLVKSSFGLDPDTVIKNWNELGGMRASDIYRAGQVFANHAAGREGLLGLQEWAIASNSGTKRLFLQWKSFALGNHAEVRRQLRVAPTNTQYYKTIAKLIVGGVAAGEAINDVRSAMFSLRDPFDAKDLDRDGKPDESFGLAITNRVGDDILTAYGTVLGAMAASATGGADKLKEFFSPPLAITTIDFGSDVTDAVVKVIQDKDLGPGDFKNIARRTPIIGPTSKGLLNRLEEEEKRRQQILKGGFGDFSIPSFDQ